ncbi:MULTISPECIES: hypothetical protein [unclassified Pseudomonas]|uniref:hypothetical protein n=1 Tax=unclassified Pseudomonas TaxID=196821 RepID=UPI00244B22F6|nr:MULTISPECIES: hypothetical protein [unclassified Pseudomonas]MDG9928258.1 hypothetical protein [Pseudomonas sp. GD04042]MDH0481178.1 hypothetical protein [Pseudomonas sp. GD04015]MDH0604514.1 hypothetical protein [Pseudomonas sp. GD03869]
MLCPACNHEAPQSDFGEPLRCPSCGAYYAKALAAKQRRDVETAEKVQTAAETAREINRAPPPKAKGFRVAADHVEVATRGLDGVQPVVVVDIQMRFWSMMVFMIKWMLAAIPALIVFIAIISVLSAVFGTFFSVLFGLPK